MSRSYRTTVWITGSTASVPASLSAEELAASAGIRIARLRRFVRAGLVEPRSSAGEEFAPEALVRLKRVLRLRASLGLSLASAALIADLIDRIEGLEEELARLQGRDATASDRTEESDPQTAS